MKRQVKRLMISAAALMLVAAPAVQVDAWGNTGHRLIGVAAMRGLSDDLPAFLRTRNSEQFLLGALIGAAAAWVLSDEELRGKIVKSAMKLYAGVAGGFEEMKEQMADIRAEVEAEQHGDA